MTWETVIGIEIHVQLATQSKIFSGASTCFGAAPNTQACAVDLAMPGVLPVLNEQAVAYALRFGLSIGAKIPRYTQFARKNYFYPDLPKGYQISQADDPIVGEGRIDITLENGDKKCIGVTRAHLEEDAGKSLHGDLPGYSGIDLNRAGTPLLEIVSEPDMRSAKEAVAYVKTLHNLVCYLGICDGNMQEGSFRCDVNVSLRKKGAPEFGTRTETKNLNSFRFIERAILYEVDRQQALLETGGTVHQETLLYDADKDETRSMRSKENAHDYRYFTDPDLLPVQITDAMLHDVQSKLPELPWEKQARFISDFNLSEYDASFLVSDIDISLYFEAVLAAGKAHSPKLVTNWIAGDLSAFLNKAHLPIKQSPIKPAALSALLMRIEDSTISNSIAKTVFEAMWEDLGSPDEIIAQKGLQQITDNSALESLVDEIIQNNPEQVAQYRGGKDKLFSFFVGQAMKATRGKANPKQLTGILKEKLGPVAN